MELYIVVLTNKRKTVTIAVYDEDEEKAKATAIEMYMGWEIKSIHLRGGPARIVIHAKFNEDIEENFLG